MILENCVCMSASEKHVCVCARTLHCILYQAVMWLFLMDVISCRQEPSSPTVMSKNSMRSTVCLSQWTKSNQLPSNSIYLKNHITFLYLRHKRKKKCNQSSTLYVFRNFTTQSYTHIYTLVRKCV